MHSCFHFMHLLHKLLKISINLLIVKITAFNQLKYMNMVKIWLAVKYITFTQSYALHYVY